MYEHGIVMASDSSLKLPLPCSQKLAWQPGRPYNTRFVWPSLRQIKHTHPPTSPPLRSVPQTQHLNPHYLRAQSNAFDKPRPRQMAPGKPQSIVPLAQPADGHYITQRLPQVPEIEDADFVLMLIIDVDQCCALLPPEMDDRGELDAFVAGLETAAVPLVGGGGLLVGFV